MSFEFGLFGPRGVTLGMCWKADGGPERTASILNPRRGGEEQVWTAYERRRKLNSHFEQQCGNNPTSSKYPFASGDRSGPLGSIRSKDLRHHGTESLYSLRAESEPLTPGAQIGWALKSNLGSTDNRGGP